MLLSIHACNCVTTPAQLPLILVADDEPEDIFLTQHVVQKLGAKNNVIAFVSGTAVMNYLQRWLAVDAGDWIKGGLLLLDLKMPDNSGFDVITWVRAQPRLEGLRIIALTHSLDPSQHARALELGANACLDKADLESLRGAIKDALDEPAQKAS